MRLEKETKNEIELNRESKPEKELSLDCLIWLAEEMKLFPHLYGSHLEEYLETYGLDLSGNTESSKALLFEVEAFLAENRIRIFKNYQEERWEWEMEGKLIKTTVSSDFFSSRNEAIKDAIEFLHTMQKHRK